MSKMCQCPLCCRLHEVADDGTIQTWKVEWIDQESIPIKRKKKQYLSSDRHQRLIELRAKYARQEPNEEDDFIANRSTCFIHRDDAEREYNWVKDILVKRGDYDEQKSYLTPTEGERVSWHELFESPNSRWLASGNGGYVSPSLYVDSGPAMGLNLDEGDVDE